MNFQIKALPETDFSHLFQLSDSALAKLQACRQTVSAKPAPPCRVSLEDAEVGETVILLNYVHQPAQSPYQASHAIFVRQSAKRADIAPNIVPQAIRSRLISVRLFDEHHMMIGADVILGDEVADALNKAFEQAAVAYIHLHYAKPGCFAASVHRVP